MLTTGLLSITFRKKTPAEIIELTAKAGLNGIEWGGDIHVPPGDEAAARSISQRTRDAGLSVAAYGSYYRCETGTDPETAFRPVLATAIALGAPLIRVWPGTVGSEAFTPAARSELIDHSRTIADMAAAEGITVASEYHGGTITDTPAAAQAFLEDINHPNYRSLWQPPVGMTPDRCCQALLDLLPFVANVHVFHWGDTAKDRFPLQDGAPTWRRYLDILRSSGREHACLLEFVKNDDPEQFLADAVALKRLVEAN
jgi:sugar phosphate isomerase/epimerase